MADSPDLGVVDHRCEVFGYEGLFCMDSSAIPNSLGVNPSLTISAVCERAATELVARSTDLGLPDSGQRYLARPPAETIGERVHAPDNDPPAPAAPAAGRRRKRKRWKKRRRKHRGRREGAPRRS